MSGNWTRSAAPRPSLHLLQNDSGPLLVLATSEASTQSPAAPFRPSLRGAQRRRNLPQPLSACHCEERSVDAISRSPFPPVTATSEASTQSPAAPFRPSLRGAQRRRNLPQPLSARHCEERSVDAISRSPFPPVTARSAASTQSPAAPFRPSLRGAQRRRNLPQPLSACHCEERSDEAISPSPARGSRLLRCARNDKDAGDAHTGRAERSFASLRMKSAGRYVGKLDAKGPRALPPAPWRTRLGI